MFHLSESGKLFIKKASLTEKVIELFSTLRFSVHETDGGSVSVTARQQTYCASNFEQGGWRGSLSISSGKGKIMERFNCKELLEKRWRDPRDDPCLMYKPAKKLL